MAVNFFTLCNLKIKKKNYNIETLLRVMSVSGAVVR